MRSLLEKPNAPACPKKSWGHNRSNSLEIIFKRNILTTASASRIIIMKGKTMDISKAAAALGKIGGMVKSKAKHTKTSFNTKSAKTAIKIRWKKYQEKKEVENE